MGQRQVPEFDEGADHEDAYLDGARRVEDGGGHDGAVLSESVGGMLAVLPTPRL